MAREQGTQVVPELPKGSHCIPGIYIATGDGWVTKISIDYIYFILITYRTDFHNIFGKFI